MSTAESISPDLPEARYAEALKIVADRASLPYLQRRLRCSYNQAKALLERMVSEGVITTYLDRPPASPQKTLAARLIEACRRDALTWTDRKAIGEAIARIEVSAQQVAPAHAVEVPGVLEETWRPMETAPKNGTLIRLLVEFEHHATEDGEGPHPTIGANTWDNHHDFDEWQFAGWDWSQDCYTQGVGKPVGWLPMAFSDPTPPAPILVPTQDTEREEFEAWCMRQTEWRPELRKIARGYASPFTQSAWEAWLGRAEKASAVPNRPATGSHPSDLVNTAHILASDGPGTVVKKLDSAYDSACRKLEAATATLKKGGA